MTWRGWLSQEQLRKEIDESRVLALPSLWPEPFGLAGTEARARARPVAAYDVGGVREWITGGGIVVARADEPALARAIITLTNDCASWMTYAAGARKHAERFRVSAHIRRLQDVLAPRAGKGSPP